MIDPDLLEHIYDVCLGRSSWEQILGRLRGGFDADLGVLIASGQGAKAVRCLCWQDDGAGMWQPYAEHFCNVDPFARSMRSGAMPPGRVMLGDDLVPSKVLCSSEYYQDWLRPRGMRYSALAYVQGRGGRYLQFGIARSLAAGVFSPEELRTLQVYFGHVRRAMEIQQELAARNATPDFDQIAARFGLTPAEVRLAEMLAETGSLRTSAERSGRSYHTLRSQLRAVLEKTGAGSQTELMRLIHRAPAA